jgi:sugar/nucleoside kinase (ribokinase family)
VAEERIGPGGAGNVAANLVALGVAEVHCIGCVGRDLYGQALTGALRELGCDASGIQPQEEGFATRAYVKPYLDGKELSRLDHGVRNRISPATTRRMAARLEALLPELDAVVLNQQVAAGVWSEELLHEVTHLAEARPAVTWVADSRDRPDRFGGMTLKLNVHEAARMCARDVPPGSPIAEADTVADLERIFRDLGGAIVITRGADGAVARDASGSYAVGGVPVAGETDTVGAGDAFTSGLAACLGAGVGLETAIGVANLAAAVTVKKLGRTGTASAEEIRATAAALIG